MGEETRADCVKELRLQYNTRNRSAILRLCTNVQNGMPFSIPQVEQGPKAITNSYTHRSAQPPAGAANP